MDNLILTTIAAGLIGGIVFLIIVTTFAVTRTIAWIDGWSGWRSASKIIRAVAADRRERGWERQQKVGAWRWAK